MPGLEGSASLINSTILVQVDYQAQSQVEGLPFANGVLEGKEVRVVQRFCQNQRDWAPAPSWLGLAHPLDRRNGQLAPNRQEVFLPGQVFPDDFPGDFTGSPTRDG